MMSTRLAWIAEVKCDRIGGYPVIFGSLFLAAQIQILRSFPSTQRARKQLNSACFRKIKDFVEKRMYYGRVNSCILSWYERMGDTEDACTWHSSWKSMCLKHMFTPVPHYFDHDCSTILYPSSPSPIVILWRCQSSLQRLYYSLPLQVRIPRILQLSWGIQVKIQQHRLYVPVHQLNLSLY